MDNHSAAHALLAPSAAEQWLNCPASVRLSRDLPEEESSAYAKEGSYAHSVAEDFLRFGKTDKEVSDEMLEHVMVYVDYAASLVGFDSEYGVESKGPCSFKSSVAKYLFGTADFWALSGDTLTIVDFKYGQGVKVQAEENSQLKLYALSVLLKLKNPSVIEKVRLVIIQPRTPIGAPIEEWDTTPKDLLVWDEKTVSPCAEAALHVAAEPKAGPWCRWCKASGTTCFTGAGDVTPMVVAPLDLEKAVKVLEVADTFNRVNKAAYSMLLAELERGVSVPGVKLVRGRAGVRKWLDADKAQAELVKALGDGAFKPRELVSVAQAEKSIGGKDKFKGLEYLVYQEAGANKVVVADDSREAIGTTMEALD